METDDAIAKNVRAYLANIGRKGGQKSRRTLTPQQAKNMVRVREARRAFKKHYARCFWSSHPDMQITEQDVDWVAQRLQDYGDRSMWLLGRKLAS